MSNDLPNPMAPHSADGSSTATHPAHRPSRWRTVVLPVLRLAVFAIIAIALVKVAFFPADAAPASEALLPDGELYDPTVLVETGDISNDIELEGVIVRDASRAVLSTVQGEIGTVFVSEGQPVERGERIYQIRTQHVPDPVEPTEHNPDPVQPQPYYTFADVAAPASGTLVDFPFLVGMAVDIGTETGSIQPSTFHVEASITAAQQYRFTENPESATITITDGPAPFDCTDVTIVQDEGAPAESGGGTGGGAAVHCPVAADVRVFPGLAVSLRVAGGSAEGVLMLPTTAVIGTADVGAVFLPGVDGEPEEHPVRLGLNDGSMVEISEGLREGDEVLLYAPGGAPEVDCEDPEQYDPLFCEVMP